MKKLLKQREFLTALISLTVTAACSIWFYTRPGTQGLMAWQPSYANLFRLLFCVCLIPVLALIPWLIWKNKPSSIVSFIFSGLAAFGWFMLFLVLNIMNSLGEPAENLNLLSISDPLPVHEVSADDVESPVIRLGFGSDPHWGSSAQNTDACLKIMDGLAAKDNDAVFLLGDIVELGILNYYPAAIDAMETHLKDVPLRVIPGNHDAIACAIPHFKKMFNQKGEPDYYRMDGGNVHILVLCMLWDEHEFSRKQEKWLISQLESIPEEDTVIVVSHCYLYGSGTVSKSSGKIWGDIPGVIEKICPILEKYNVDLAVSGHNHNFEYLESNETSYCVIGTMGGNLDKTIYYSSPQSKWTDFNSYGWLEATVYTDRIELVYLNEQGKTLHTETVMLNAR